MKKSIVAVLIAAAIPCNVLAWGTNGHRMINRLATQALPASLPAFVRTPEALYEIETLGGEEDRLKGAGESWDEDNDPGHFVDADDAQGIDGVVKLNALPDSMGAYAKALASVNKDPYREGYLPYSIMDGFERVRKDFAIWRVDDYMVAHAQTAAAKQEFARDKHLRETLTLRDIGDWGHFVGDGCQPLHVTYHFNGWGTGPNPNGFSTSHHMHAMFESDFVDAHVKLDDIRKHVAGYQEHRPAAALSQENVASLVGAYLAGSAEAVPHVYDLEKAGAFAAATPGAVDFTAAQLGRGASELRDLIALAYEDSVNEKVGYPEIPVKDILSGKVTPRDSND